MIDVLVVDDDPEIVDLIRYTLNDCRVRTANDGDEALQAVTQDMPDLVVLDVMMPGISGLQVLELWRSDPITERLPVILLTAKAQEADVDRGFELGADDYLTKPFSPVELSRRVKAVTNRTKHG